MTLNDKLKSASKLDLHQNRFLMVEIYSDVVEHLIKEIRENPHDATLGKKLREYGLNYLDVYKRGEK